MFIFAFLWKMLILSELRPFRLVVVLD